MTLVLGRQAGETGKYVSISEDAASLLLLSSLTNQLLEDFLEKPHHTYSFPVGLIAFHHIGLWRIMELWSRVYRHVKLGYMH